MDLFASSFLLIGLEILGVKCYLHYSKFLFARQQNDMPTQVTSVTGFTPVDMEGGRTAESEEVTLPWKTPLKSETTVIQFIYPTLDASRSDS